jgi:hypothetical protein
VSKWDGTRRNRRNIDPISILRQNRQPDDGEGDQLRDVG